MMIAETEHHKLVACSKYSDQNPTPTARVEHIIDEYFRPLHDSDVTRVRWFLAKYESPGATDFAKFLDAAWQAVFTDGERRQAILFQAANDYYAFVYKPDQRKISLTVENTEPDVYQLEVPANRYGQNKTKN